MGSNGFQVALESNQISKIMLLELFEDIGLYIINIKEDETTSQQLLFSHLSIQLFTYCTLNSILQNPTENQITRKYSHLPGVKSFNAEFANNKIICFVSTLKN